MQKLKPDQLESKLTVYLHGNEQKIGPRYNSYHLAVIICRRIFPALANATNIGFYAMDLAINEGYPVEVCEEAWKDVTVKKMVVVDQSSKLVDLSETRLRLPVIIKTMTGKTLSVEWNSTVVNAKERIQELDGTPAHLQQLTYNGKEKIDNVNLVSFSGETLHLKWKRTEAQ